MQVIFRPLSVLQRIDKPSKHEVQILSTFRPPAASHSYSNGNIRQVAVVTETYL
jgi:hypothetical protein